MSTIRVDNFAPSAGGTAFGIEGIAKAWATTNDSPALVDSYNISSIDDNGTGDFDLNLTNAMSNDDFSCPANENGNSADMVASAAISTSEANFDIWSATPARRDRGLNALMLGDLA